jgi:hypothetical protein
MNQQSSKFVIRDADVSHGCKNAGTENRKERFTATRKSLNKCRVNNRRNGRASAQLDKHSRRQRAGLIRRHSTGWRSSDVDISVDLSDCSNYCIWCRIEYTWDGGVRTRYMYVVMDGALYVTRWLVKSVCFIVGDWPRRRAPSTWDRTSQAVPTSEGVMYVTVWGSDTSLGTTCTPSQVVAAAIDCT